MCSLCGDPTHKDMQCPCFGYSGGEYRPPDRPHRSDPSRLRRGLTEEFSASRRALASPPETSPSPRRR